jgi:hypothetical protein
VVERREQDQDQKHDQDGEDAHPFFGGETVGFWLGFVLWTRVVDAGTALKRVVPEIYFWHRNGTVLAQFWAGEVISNQFGLSNQGCE